MHQYLSDYLEIMANIYMKPQSWEAVWMQEPLQTPQGFSRRIAAGDKVKVYNDNLIACETDPTHIVQLCYGTLYGPFFITLTHLETNEPITIKI